MRKSTEADNLAASAGTLACSICGTANAPSADFCRCCGVSISHRSAFGPLADSAGFCRQCQCAHALPACFCDQCGSKLPGYVRSRANNPVGLNETTNALPKDALRELAVPAARAGNKAGAVASVSRPPPAAASTAPIRKLPIRFFFPAALAVSACGALLFNIYQPTHIGTQQEVDIVQRAPPARHKTGPVLPEASAPAAPVPPEPSLAPPTTLPGPRAAAALATPDMPHAEAAETVQPSRELVPPPGLVPVSEATHIAVDSGEVALIPLSQIRQRPPLPLLEFTSFVQIESSSD